MVLTPAALAARVAAFAARLPREVPIAIVGRASADAVAAILAAWELGATYVAIHPRLTEAERRPLIARAGAPVLVDGEQIHPTHVPARRLDAAALLFTSGTTGTPKGALLSHRALAAAADVHAANLPWRDDDRWLLSLPVAHIAGLGIVVRCARAGKTIVIGPADPAHLAQATLASLVPAQLDPLADLPPPPSLRAILLGGAAASPRLLERARSWPLLPTYGLTEACGQVATAGRPLIPLRIVDERIEIAGPTLMDGYLDEPPLAGWFATGDHGRLDDGKLTVLGRRTDLIVTGGENVYPAEVEAVLETAPGVTGALVAGVPDERWGQLVGALVTGGPDLDALGQFCAERLAPFKRPRLLAHVDTLPRTPAGKPDRERATAVLGCRA